MNGHCPLQPLSGVPSRRSFASSTEHKGRSTIVGALRPPLGILGEQPVVGRRQRCPT